MKEKDIVEKLSKAGGHIFRLNHHDQHIISILITLCMFSFHCHASLLKETSFGLWITRLGESQQSRHKTRNANIHTLEGITEHTLTLKVFRGSCSQSKGSFLSTDILGSFPSPCVMSVNVFCLVAVVSFDFYSLVLFISFSLLHCSMLKPSLSSRFLPSTTTSCSQRPSSSLSPFLSYPFLAFPHSL